VIFIEEISRQFMVLYGRQDCKGQDLEPIRFHQQLNRLSSHEYFSVQNSTGHSMHKRCPGFFLNCSCMTPKTDVLVKEFTKKED
jgi:hypothetical protein